MIQEEVGQGENLQILKNNDLCVPGPKFPWILRDLSFHCSTWSWNFLCPYSQMDVKNYFKRFHPPNHISISFQTHIFPTRLLGQCLKFWPWGLEVSGISCFLLCPLTLLQGRKETDIYSLSSARYTWYLISFSIYNNLLFLLWYYLTSEGLNAFSISHSVQDAGLSCEPLDSH